MVDDVEAFSVLPFNEAGDYVVKLAVSVARRLYFEAEVVYISAGDIESSLDAVAIFVVIRLTHFMCCYAAKSACVQCLTTSTIPAFKTG